MKSKWQILYATSAVAVILGLLFDVPPLYWAAKPLLMISLALHFLSSVRDAPRWRTTVLLALLGSWAGDVFLMSSDYFIQGLISFLLAHVFYIIAYHQTGAASGKLKAMDLLKFGLYGAVLIFIIYPGLGELLVPVLVYAGVLLFMGLWAHKRRGATSQKSFLMVATGAMLFCLSDGMIAINKFAFVIPAERVLDMTIYITAQFLIIQGLLHHPEKS
jgi:uncharacterized membrane protein YhhN